MIYPEFIKENETIGICAPSAGLGGRIEDLEAAESVLKSFGFKLKETKSVRNKGARSTSAKKRAQEFNQLIEDKNVKFINFATGGDFMFEILPYVDLEKIKQNPKWMMGLSDPTNLLYLVTTNLDIATMYGHNACSFDFSLQGEKDVAIEFMKGNIKTQKSFKYYYDFMDLKNGYYDNLHPVKWLSRKDVEFKGRCIGGCFEVIANHMGTKFDKTNDFIDRYKNDGIVWYFDVFNMTSYFYYLTLLQMKYAGYFRYCKGIMLGRVCFPTIENKNLDYIKATQKALGNIPVIAEADIGHTHPTMTFINGAIIDVKCKDSKGTIKFKL